MRINTIYRLLLFFCTLSVFNGCGDSTTTPSSTSKGIDFSVSGFSPARGGETYALWLAFPVNKIISKGQTPQHGDKLEYVRVSTFDVDASGKISEFDTTNLNGKLGHDISLATHAMISVEKIDSLGEEPNAPMIAGDISGTVTTGNAALSPANPDAIGYSFISAAGTATLASPDDSPDDYKGEVYLMNATSASATATGLANIAPLTTKWRYAMWVVDSSTKSLPPFNIFFGYVSDALQKDSDTSDNRFNYPGGRYPADTTQPVYDLTAGGRATLMITLEPNFYARPATPFGAIILRTVIPQGLQRFVPFTLKNIAPSLPTASIILHR